MFIDTSHDAGDPEPARAVVVKVVRPRPKPEFCFPVPDNPWDSRTCGQVLLRNFGD